MGKKPNDENELADSHLVAAQVTPFIEMADNLLDIGVDFELWQHKIERMEDSQSYMAAWPTEETMSKAREMRSQVEVFKTLYKFLEARKASREIIIEEAKRESVGKHILKELGLG